MRIPTVCLLVVSLGASTAWSQAPNQAPPANETERLQRQLDRAQRTLKDWPNMNRYRAANAQLAAPAPGENRVVFMGDSITDNWANRRKEFFSNKLYIGRGIGGQTTPQMLLRFRPDVIDLKPKVVVILAGTNDIAGNTGPMTVEETEGNIQSMAELAKLNGIKVVLSSVTPVCDYIRNQTDARPPATILAINAWLKDYAAKNGFVYLDYYNSMLDEKQMLRQELTADGLHPNDAGYDIMEPMVVKAIGEALGK